MLTISHGIRSGQSNKRASPTWTVANLHASRLGGGLLD